MQSFLKQYLSNIADSLLARIYGLYEIRVGDQEPFSFILMGNIASPDCEVISQFDIKGSKHKRRVADLTINNTDSIDSFTSLDSSIVYKDVDFKNFIGNIRPYNGLILMEKL